MKVGIFNLFIDTNYGGNLQRFALCKVLQKLGCSVFFIPRRFCVDVPKFPKSSALYAKRFFKKIFFDRKLNVFHERDIARDYSIQFPQVFAFIEKNVPCVEHCYWDDENLESVNNFNFDAVVVGSDQVWRNSAGADSIYAYFLDFLKSDVKKIAYAASFGNDGYGYTFKQIEKCRELLKTFSAVSVREIGALSVMKKFGWCSDKNVRVVLDPTLLTTAQDYEFMMEDTVKKQGVFAYILDTSPRKRNFVNRVARNLSLDVSILDSLFPNYGCKNGSQIIPTIEQWVANIANADFVVTDSFHGTMFSIIFNKPFFTIVNKERGASRYNPLLDDLGLADRLILPDELDSVSLDGICEIDWRLVNEILEMKKSESIAFLKEYLSK